MPIFTNPEFQQFVEQQTGTNPVEALRSHLPTSITGETGAAIYPRGTPISTQVGQSVYDALERKQFLKPVGDYFSTLGSNSGRSAMLTALALGLGGAGFGAVTGRNPVTWGLAGAGLGALGGYGASELTSSLSRRRNQRGMQTMAQDEENRQRLQRIQDVTPKVASSYYGMGDTDPMTYIQSRIFADQSMGPADKSMLVSTVQSLPPQQLMTLSDMLRTAAGAAAGYIITRFLLNMGGLGQTLGMAAGGALGAMMGNRLPVNAFGEQVDTSQDLFGRRRLVN
jgi:hypothetical protein